MIVLLVLLLAGAGAFAATQSSSASNYKSKYNTATASLKKVQGELDTANNQLSDLKATNGDQSQQIAAYKACLADLNTLFADANNNVTIPRSVSVAAQKDCVPLGLIG